VIRFIIVKITEHRIIISLSKPWFKEVEPIPIGSKVAIIGGGISGLMMAHHFKEAGYKVKLIEKSGKLMSGASGNPIAILDPFISAKNSVEKNLYLDSYKYAAAFYENLNRPIFKKCGLIKIAKDEFEKNRFEKISYTYSSDILTFKNNRLFFPDAGFIFPEKLATSLLSEQDLLLNTNIERIERGDDQQWSLYNSEDRIVFKAETIIICNSFSASKFKQTNHLTFNEMCGQITYVSPQYSEKSILCSEGYLSPPVETGDGLSHILGATFDRNHDSTITQKAHFENLKKSPLHFEPDMIKGGRIGIRAMTTDRLPLSGPVAIYRASIDQYKDLHHGPAHKKFPPASYYPNLFINAGLGARGFLTAPFLAKLLCEQISDQKLSYDRNITQSLHPERFIIRRLSKRQASK